MPPSPEFNVSESPWTPEEVDHINDWQDYPHVHPFTCPCDHPETPDHVLLTATETGLVCPEPSCEYEQSWVHAFMADGSTLAALRAHPFLGTH